LIKDLFCKIINCFDAKPGHYIAHLIGHEGPGSLLSELKSRGLCTVLSAYDRRGAKGFGFFNVSVDLTPEGIEKTDDIITLIFQYINLLKVNHISIDFNEFVYK
jgi:insulysin